MTRKQKLQVELDITYALAENLEASAELFLKQIQRTKQALKQGGENGK